MKTTTDRKFNAPLIHNPEPRVSPKEIEKIKAEHRKRHAREFAPIMFETTTGARLTKGEAAPPPRELFGPLWRQGELAILAGAGGVGKTLLAIHLAESLARGSSIVHSAFSILHSAPVLYIDLCHSLDQFRQRYTCPSIFPERPPVKYRFSSRFHRAGFDRDMTVPEAFEGKFLDYFNHSINKLIARTTAKVIIIDDLAALTPTTLSNAAYARTLRNLKTFTAHASGISILVLMDCQQKIKHKRSATGDQNFPLSTIHSSLSSIHSSLVGIADSVFTLCPSTFSPDIRYIKHLAGARGLKAPLPGQEGWHRLGDGVVDSPDVLTFQLQSTPGPREASLRSSPITHNSSLNAAPFPGFTYLGTCQEQQHLRDYAAEALAATRAHQAELRRLWKRSSKDILVDGVLDGSYGRYLKGE